MPFCRKCGRCLSPYSEKCTQCGTSTTGPLIKIKKASAIADKFKTDTSTKVTKAVVPARDVTFSVKVIDSTKSAKTVFTVENNNAITPAKQVTPIRSALPHEIKQSKLSLEEDIITNPHDYETKTFAFDLQCSNEHFWPQNKALPVSKGKAYCPKCGELVKEIHRKSKQRRFHSF